MRCSEKKPKTTADNGLQVEIGLKITKAAAHQVVSDALAALQQHVAAWAVDAVWQCTIIAPVTATATHAAAATATAAAVILRHRIIPGSSGSSSRCCHCLCPDVAVTVAQRRRLLLLLLLRCCCCGQPLAAPTGPRPRERQQPHQPAQCVKACCDAQLRRQAKLLQDMAVAARELLKQQSQRARGLIRFPFNAHST